MFACVHVFCAICVHNIQVVAVYGHQKKTAAVTLQFTMTFATGKDYKGLGVAAVGVEQHQGVWQH